MTATRTCSLIVSLTQTKKEDFCKQFIVQEVHKKHCNYSNDCDGTQLITLSHLQEPITLHLAIPCIQRHGHQSFIIFLFVCFCVCLFVDPINGGWTDWTAWFPCSVSCGRGIQISIRYCTNPYPARGGNRCVGPSVKRQICNPQRCPCKYCSVAFLIYVIYIYIPITDVRTTAKL